MFANLKKKIEEEVGDLSKLTSPMNAAGALGDRRVGGSTQGTNTPANLGSRRSSLASLVSFDTLDRQTQVRIQTAGANQASRDLESSDEINLLKKQNADLRSKVETLKKAYEEKLQSQETDFARKYNMKEEEVVELKSERDKLKEKLKISESGWQEKYMRVATELENLEGLSKQENAKVKHLLLNTQNDLQIAMRKIAELECESKNRKDQKNASLMLVTGSDGHKVQTQEPELVAFESSYGSLEESLREQIKVLELENCAIKKLLETNQELTRSLENRLSESSQYFEENTSLKVQLAELRQDLQHLRLQYELSSQDRDERSKDLQLAEAELKVLKKNYHEQVLKLKNVDDENFEMKDRLKQYENIISSLQVEEKVDASSSLVLSTGNSNTVLDEINVLEAIKALKQENESLIGQVNSLRESKKTLNAGSQTSAKPSEEIPQLRYKYEELLLHSEQLKQELIQANDQIISYSRKLSAGAADIQYLREELQKDKHRIAFLESQHESATASCLTTSEEIIELKSQLESSIANNQQQNAQLILLKSDIEQLKSSLTESQHSVKEMAQDIESKNLRIAELESNLDLKTKKEDEALNSAQGTDVVSSSNEVVLQKDAKADESAKVQSVQAELCRLNGVLSDTRATIVTFQEEKAALQTQLEELSVLKSLAEEEAKTSSDRCAEMYNEVTELKKSLRTSKQQISELKKLTTRHEPISTGIVARKNLSISSMEEVSLSDSMHHAEVPFSEVNYLYMRSVLFKYLTASDPHVAASLVRVVSTLLELKPEEEKLLRETHESHKKWFNGLIKK